MINAATDKIKKYVERFNWTQYRDVRVIAQVVFGIIVLLITWSGAKAIQTNFSLEKQIAQLKQADQVQSLINANQKLQNEYYNTNQYLDLSAREMLGKGLPGETELIVPKQVALSYLAPVPTPTAPNTTTNAHQPWYETNFESWINFFLHRQS